MKVVLDRLRQWLPDLDARIWILAGGRLLSQVGIGFTLFYAPIFFVSQVGLSATQVGIGIGLGSVTGLVGRILAGSWVDSPTWGRRPTLLISALVSAVADGLLVLAQGFPVFLLGNVLMGFGVGLYWPATETVAADLTSDQQRNEAYALVRLADNVGLGLGVVFGGLLISLTGAYRALFVVDGLTFLLFFGIIYGAIAETRPPGNPPKAFWQGWGQALKDRPLLVFTLVNVLLTSYLAQVQSTLPVYLNRVVTPGFSEGRLSLLFTGHVGLAIVAQLPIARWLKPYPPTQGLTGSALLWGVGFCLVWLAGTQTGSYLWAGLALGVMALAMVAYTPIASALVVAMAADDQRGVYLSVNSLAWAFGYLVAPPLGGWALDQGTAVAHGFWLGLALTVLPLWGMLYGLNRQLRQRGL